MTFICPLTEKKHKVFDLGEEFLREMHKLRRELDQCEKCPQYDDCKRLQEFYTKIDGVINEIVDEWGYEF